jgi:hypothetical protein
MVLTTAHRIYYSPAIGAKIFNFGGSEEVAPRLWASLLFTPLLRSTFPEETTRR